jgi:hypothetical protein
LRGFSSEKNRQIPANSFVLAILLLGMFGRISQRVRQNFGWTNASDPLLRSFIYNHLASSLASSESDK